MRCEVKLFLLIRIPRSRLRTSCDHASLQLSMWLCDSATSSYPLTALLHLLILQPPVKTLICPRTPSCPQPPPLMLPVTALYDLILSENSLIRPWPPSYPSRGLSKDSDSGAFCSEGGRLASGWLVSTSAINSLPHILTSFHQVHSIWQLPHHPLYVDWIPLAKLFGTKSFVWFFEDATKIMSNPEPGQRKEIPPLCKRVCGGKALQTVNVFES